MALLANSSTEIQSHLITTIKYGGEAPHIFNITQVEISYELHILEPLVPTDKELGGYQSQFV
jgi:hypothetical protein